MPASISVRCAIWRWMRWRMLRKAAAACRTSVAPWGRKVGTSTPRPKASAAMASLRSERTWLRRNSMAMARVTSAVPTIQLSTTKTIEV